MKCDKLTYKTKAEANQSIKLLNNTKTALRKRKLTRAYHCPDCNKWHMTSKESKRKRIRLQKHKMNCKMSMV